MLLYHADSINIRYLPNVEPQLNKPTNLDPQWKKKARLKLGETLATNPPQQWKEHNYISCHWYN